MPPQQQNQQNNQQPPKPAATDHPPTANAAPAAAAAAPPPPNQPVGPHPVSAPPVPEAAAAASAVAERDRNGVLTRAGIETVLRQGGTVLMRNPDGPGHLMVAHASHIPGDVALTRNDPAARDRAIADKRAERERLNAELEQLEEAKANADESSATAKARK